MNHKYLFRQILRGPVKQLLHLPRLSPTHSNSLQLSTPLPLLTPNLLPKFKFWAKVTLKWSLWHLFDFIFDRKTVWPENIKISIRKYIFFVSKFFHHDLLRIWSPDFFLWIKIYVILEMPDWPAENNQQSSYEFYKIKHFFNIFTFNCQIFGLWTSLWSESSSRASQHGNLMAGKHISQSVRENVNQKYQKNACGAKKMCSGISRKTYIG